MVKNRSKVKMAPTKKSQTRPKVKLAPVAITTSRQAVSKKITQKGDLVTIHHRELLVPSYTAGINFSVDYRFALNPGLSAYSGGSPMGTWLPSIAKNYDRYRFKKLMFHFTTYAATTTPGMVIMSYDPNPENANPSSLANAQNQFFKNGSVHDNLTFDISSKVPNEFRFTRSGPVSTLTTYDAGFVNVSSIGSTLNPVGLIEVEYIVEFKQPQSSSTMTTSVPTVPVLPVQVWTSGYSTATSATLYVAANTFGDIFAPQFLFNGTTIGTNPTFSGADLIEYGNITTATTVSGGQWAFPNGTVNSPGVVDSIPFTAYPDSTSYGIGGLTRPCFRFKNSGRYRLEFEAPFDISKESTAGYGLFGFKRTPANGSAPYWVSPIREFSNFNGTVSSMRAIKVYAQQGTENSTTPPKTAGESTLRMDFEVAVRDDEWYTLLGGCEVGTLVGTSCVLTPRVGTSPAPRVIVTYLGPRLTENGIYDSI